MEPVCELRSRAQKGRHRMKGAENVTEGTQDMGQCVKRPPLGKKKWGGGDRSRSGHTSEWCSGGRGALSSSLSFLSDARGEVLS